MTLRRIIDICKKYDQLGSSVQEQLDDVLAGRIDECNPNAVKLAREFITSVKRHADSPELVKDCNAVLNIT